MPLTQKATDPSLQRIRAAPADGNHAICIVSFRRRRCGLQLRFLLPLLQRRVLVQQRLLPLAALRKLFLDGGKALPQRLDRGGSELSLRVVQQCL
jgi:hypothetical protein